MDAIRDLLVKDEDFYRRKNASVDELFNNPKIHELLVSQKLDRDYIAAHWIEFLNYQEDMTCCANCPGYERCPKNFPGYCRQLSIDDGELTSRYVRCEKAGPFSDIYAYLKTNLPLAAFDVTFEKARLEGQSLLLTSSLLKLEGKGLYVYGGVGAGKTYLMAAYARLLASRQKLVGFYSLPGLLADLRRTFNHEESIDLDEITRLPVLILDDIGGEAFSPWARDEILYNLLNERMLRHLVTCFTSLYSPRELARHYQSGRGSDEKLKAERIVSRVLALADPFPLEVEKAR